MYGFLIFPKRYKETIVHDQFPNMAIVMEYCIGYNPMPKFEKDHIFYEGHNLFVLLDGVILNKTELLDKIDITWEEYFCELVMQGVDEAICRLRGSFRGIVINKTNDEITIFTNQYGEKTVFFYGSNSKDFVAGSCFKDVISVLKNSGHELDVNYQSNYEMLLTGSILHGNTMIEQIRRLQGGTKITIDENHISLSRYHIFHNMPLFNGSMEDCVIEADRLYRKAVERIFNKNCEYGYKLECDLSGGLDSRMATWVAHELGYKKILNICYCSEGKLDNKISRKIANDIGNDYFFYPMNEKVLMDVDEKITANNGCVAYFHSTGAINALRSAGEQNLGITCTGLMGEIQDAYWTEGMEHSQPQYTDQRRSNSLELTIPDYYSYGYDTFEQMNLYELGFNTIWLTTLARQQDVEVCSPVMDVDYLEFVMSIPIEYRKDYKFKQYFIMSRYPEAAKYVWQMFRMPVKNHFENSIYWPKMVNDISRLFVRGINSTLKAMKVHHKLLLEDDMNPFQAWYDNSMELRDFYQKYFEDNINLISIDKLKKDLTKMFFDTNKAIDKMLVINLLSIWKNYLASLNVKQNTCV